MSTMTSICSGCIWEDDCRAAGLCSSDCDDFCDTYQEITYSAIVYLQDLAERHSDYIELMEEQQA